MVEGPGDAGPVSNDTRHAQMAEGLFHRFRDVVRSMERRNAFIWDAPGVEGDSAWMEGRGTSSGPPHDR